MLQEVEEIIKRNKYMVLSTSDKNGKPWAAVVFFVRDKQNTFFFLSAIDSLHAENTLLNPNVAFVIYNSESPLGSSESIQGKGKVKLVEKNEIEKVIKLYCKKLFPDSDLEPTKRYIPSDYLAPSEFRFFKIEPEEMDISGVAFRRMRV